MALGRATTLFDVQAGRTVGTFRPSRSLLRGPAKSILRFHITDRATPALAATADASGVMMHAAFRAVGARMEANIKRRFQEGPSVWAPLKASTVLWKARHGVPWPSWTLRETLTLQDNVNRLRVNIRVSRRSGGVPSAVSLDVPASTFWSSPYVAFHEMGWGQTRRGFIREGILDTLGEVQEALAGTVGRMASILQAPEQMGIPAREFEAGFRLIPFATMPLKGFLLGLVVPPTALWAVVGAASDIRGVVRGQFTPAMVAAFLRNWGLGTFGATAKVQRRRLRRALWRTT